MGWIVIGSFSTTYLFGAKFVEYRRRPNRRKLWNDSAMLISGGLTLSSIGILITAFQRAYESFAFGQEISARGLVWQFIGITLIVISKAMKTRGAAIDEDGESKREWWVYIFASLLWALVMSIYTAFR